MTIVHYLDGLGMLYECDSDIIVLVTCQLSLIAVLENPSPSTITRALKRLYDKAEQQGVFSTDFWGASIKKVSKHSVIAANRASIQQEEYDSLVRAGQMHVNDELQRIRDAVVFDIRG